MFIIGIDDFWASYYCLEDCLYECGLDPDFIWEIWWF
jgi:hypothetical protein